MKNTTLSPDLNYFVFNMQTDLNSHPAFPVPKAISDPNLILNLLSETRREQDLLDFLNSTPAVLDQINSSTMTTF